MSEFDKKLQELRALSKWFDGHADKDREYGIIICVADKEADAYEELSQGLGFILVEFLKDLAKAHEEQIMAMAYLDELSDMERLS